MSKIYEALRQHDYKPEPGGLPPSQVGGDLLDANREMQALYRSVEAETLAIKGGKMIMFSSARRGEGKTTVCGSFAATLAQNFGRTVLILDSDRDHALSQRFRSTGEPHSVTSLEKSPETVLNTAQRFGKRGAIAAIPVGSLVGSASADSPELDVVAGIKEKLCNTFDYVLFDAPSVADVSWITSIGPMCDGVILVVEAESTRWPVLLNARLEFENSGAKVLGIFLNKRRFYIPSRVYRFL